MPPPLQLQVQAVRAYRAVGMFLGNSVLQGRLRSVEELWRLLLE